MIRHWFGLSPRARVGLGIAFLIALAATLPLGATARMLGLGGMGVAAKSLRGPVWWGGAEELQFGGSRLGTVDVMLSPWRLLIGEARLMIERRRGRADDLAGALSIGLARRGIVHVTGTVPAGPGLARLGIATVGFQDASIAFSGGRCVEAAGRVRADLGGGLAALNLANGLSGAPRCAGEALILPLVSQSGNEKLELRIMADGRYEGRVGIAAGGGVAADALAGAGFRLAGQEQVLRLSGRL